MAVINTGLILKTNGSTSDITIPLGVIRSAKVRWQGEDEVTTITSTTTNSTSGSSGSGNKSGSLTASTKTGWDLTDVKISVSASQWTEGNIVLKSDPSGSGYEEVSYIYPDWRTSASLSCTSTDPSSPSGTWYTSCEQSYDYSASVTAYWEDDDVDDSRDPKITVNGSVTQHIGTLDDGVYSSWYDASGFRAGTTNTITHNVSTSIYVRFEVEIIYDTPGHGPAVGGVLIF